MSAVGIKIPVSQRTMKATVKETAKATENCLALQNHLLLARSCGNPWERAKVTALITAALATPAKGEALIARIALVAMSAVHFKKKLANLVKLKEIKQKLQAALNHGSAFVLFENGFSLLKYDSFCQLDQWR